jgi:hypothetical protein
MADVSAARSNNTTSSLGNARSGKAVLDQLSAAERPTSAPAVDAGATKVAGFPNLKNFFPVENRLPAVKTVLAQKNLAGSFAAHIKEQLNKTMRVKIAVVDDFRAGQTHGRAVEARIRANAPSYYQRAIEVVRYNVGGLSPEATAKVIKQAATDASNKKFVAMDIAGGLEPYGVDKIQSWTGEPVNKASAGKAFEAVAQRAKLTSTQRDAWAAVARASKVIPVVTPVWNDGNTTLAALTLASSNGIVTSIDAGKGSKATEVPLFDIRMPAMDGNPHTSQSAPTFLGQALGVLNRNDVRGKVLPDLYL